MAAHCPFKLDRGCKAEEELHSLSVPREGEVWVERRTGCTQLCRLWTPCEEEEERRCTATIATSRSSSSNPCRRCPRRLTSTTSLHHLHHRLLLPAYSSVSCPAVNLEYSAGESE
jgi:hypothetical protein